MVLKPTSTSESGTSLSWCRSNQLELELGTDPNVLVQSLRSKVLGERWAVGRVSSPQLCDFAAPWR